jgi:hypothetical protein
MDFIFFIINKLNIYIHQIISKFFPLKFYNLKHNKKFKKINNILKFISEY